MARKRTPSAADSKLADVAQLYSQNLLDHGPHPRSVGWHDSVSQTLRFEQLALLISADPEAPSAFTVNDLGCGYGAMFSFLTQRFGERLTQYRGYEISKAMLDTARTAITDRRAFFVESQMVNAPADYTFVSGTFHVKLDTESDAWHRYVQSSLREIARLSTRGLAFNLLTDAVDWREDQLYYADPAEYLSFCRSQLSRRVVLLHDYPLYEWTLLVRTNGPTADLD